MTVAGLEQLADAPDLPGPLGGLLALCQRALATGARDVIALACDLPYLEAPLLARLATHAPEAPAVARYLDERWQPFFARYRAATSLSAIQNHTELQRRSLQRVLNLLNAHVLPLTPDQERQLRDWDCPEDNHSIRKRSPLVKSNPSIPATPFPAIPASSGGSPPLLLFIGAHPGVSRKRSSMRLPLATLSGPSW